MKKTFWIRLALVAAALAFIWGNSLLPAYASDAESGFVLRLCRPFISALQRLLASQGIEFSPVYILRKLAHFSEFAVLGVLMSALFLQPGPRFRAVFPALLCLAAALADEGIQIFSAGRGPSLRDTALDFCGSVCGIAVFAAVLLIVRLHKKKKT